MREEGMAILAIFHGRGFTRAIYDKLRSEVNWEGNHPKGALFHAMGVDEKGDLRVADVWESQADLDAFLKNRLMPGLQKHKVPPPDAQVFPLHNATVYPALSRLKT
jgi:hypothetical protein